MHPRRRFLQQLAGSAAVVTIGPGGVKAALAQPGGTQDAIREARPAREARMQWWRDARFGMFIHWGVYSVPAGVYQGRDIEGIGEWIQARANIPPEEYRKYPPQFNPVKFDAREWVGIAREAGMKYLVITSKHHDGFALFNSKVSDWDIVDATPYGRDVLGPLSRECKRQGLKFCTYYSILDWHHPAQTLRPTAQNPKPSHGSNSMKEGRKGEYLEFMKSQLEEIVVNYNPAVLWFDGEWVNWWTEEDGRALYNWLRRLNPSLIINNRIGKGRKGMEGLSKEGDHAGDFGTPEQQIPPSGLPGVDWESCMTMNDTWGFKSKDHNWKSTRTLVHNLVDIASKGGNFLLNVGPTSEGLIPEPSVQRLREMGQWTRMNGEAIYGTHASPFAQQLPWGRATTRPGKTYLHVFDWPGGPLSVPAVRGGVRKAYLLADRRRNIPVTRSAGGLQLTLPASAPDPHASVIVLEHPTRA